MDIQFNFVNKKRKPTIILCNPNGQELSALGLARDVEYSKALNELSEMSFEIPKYKDEEIMPYYHDVKSSKYIKVDGVGLYIIKSTNVKKKGTSQEYKSINCVGLEYELSSRNLDVLDGTYCLYDGTNANTEKSIMHIVLSYLPNWSISSVDSDLWDKWRTFSIQDTNIFNFLMSDISKTYDCVFLFDTFNRQIKIVKTSNLKKQSDVYMSGRNIIKELDIDDDSDSLVTALNVYGDGDLSIRTVNPLGTPTLYNFDYFMTTDWMSQQLINALTKWKIKCTTAKSQFTNMLSQLKTKQNELVVLESQLVDLESTGKSLDQGQSLAISNGDNASCSAYATEISANNTLIKAKKQEIENKKTEITNTQDTLLHIPKSLSINSSENFNESLRKELDPYIKQASTQNTDYATTDDMTNDEIISVASELMAWGEIQLNKSSQPIWTFDIDAINFLNLIEYKHVADQLDLGSEVTIEVDKNRDMYANAMLIGYKITLDKPDNIKLSFSSALNFRRSTYTYEELFDKTASISKSYDFESPSWKKGKNAYDTMNSYIEKGFVDITKDVLSADNQEFEISNTGIRGREYLPETDTYSPEELRMTKNVLAFSDDGFNSTKAAIGKYKLPDGSSTYGVMAESLVGKQILGKTLFLETEDKSLVWDGTGLTIKNANIILTSDNGLEQSLETTLENVANTTSKKLSDAITSIGKEINDLQYTITDGMSTIWYQDTEPQRAKAGDTWYDTSSKNKAYLAKKGGTPSRMGEHLLCGTFFVAKDIDWLPLQDKTILEALDAAISAQSTADGKIRTFYQTSMPTDGSYGDLWFDTDDKNKPYRHNGTTFVAIQDGAIVDAQNTANNAQNTANDALNKVNNIIISDGSINVDKMVGHIEAGKNNILLGVDTNRMMLNENGILITKNNGQSWDTAISAYGIVADAIQSGGTLTGINIIGGDTTSGAYMKINHDGTINGYFDGIQSYSMRHYGVASLELYDTTKLYSENRYEKISLTASANDSPGISVLSQTGMYILFNGSGDLLRVGGSLYVANDFWMGGEKDAIVPTQHHGVRTLYCTEADRAYFTTDGNSETLNNECIINLDHIFIETIELNSSCPYIVHLTSYSDAKVWVDKIDDYNFVVKSDKDTKFSYTLKAIRISFVNKYLEEKVGVLSKKDLEDLQIRAIQRISE